jgi:hypothetical protein
MVKKPLLLSTTAATAAKESGNAGESAASAVFKTVSGERSQVGGEDLLQRGFLANVGGTQVFLIPTNNIDAPSGPLGGPTAGASKLEQILRHGSAAVKGNNSTEEDMRTSEDEEEEEDDEDKGINEESLSYPSRELAKVEII